MAAELGLRERKKQRTRQLIADTARRLFAERGFEAVPVAEIAREAEVSEATLFNYFPTKEGLVYSRLEAFEEELLSSIRDRAHGESVLSAFGRFMLTPRGLLATRDPEQVEAIAAITRVITESPALLAREQQIYASYADALAALLTAETRASGSDIEPWIVARALIGLHQAVVDYSRREIVAGTRNPTLARRVRRQTQRALELLSDGLGDYRVRTDA
ncbi:MAG: TetR/AcrR family transcriptional regulator [Solirubrobacteraceae bacterium]